MNLHFFYVPVGVLLLLSCNETPKPAPAVAEEVRSYETSADTIIALRLNEMGDSALYAGDYKGALQLFQASMDSAAVEGDSFAYYDSRLDMACVYDRLGELDKSIAIGIPVLEAFIRSGDSSRIGRTYATLSAFYARAEMRKEQLETAQKGFDILKTYGSTIERCAAYNQMAFTYSDSNDWVRALPLLDTALMLMKSSGVLDQLAGMYLNVGNCHRELGNFPQAHRYLNASVALADSSGQPHIQARALERLSQIAEATGDAPTALRLFREADDIRDSLFTAEKAGQISELEVQYKTREKDQEILLLRAEENAGKAQRKFMWALWLGSLSLAAFGLLRWREKAQRTQRALLESRSQLQEFAQLLLSKNTRLMELENEAGKPLSDPETVVASTPDEQEDEQEIPSQALYNFRILTDKDWMTFKQLFERSYPQYIQRLRARFPDISGAEERLALLLKINLHRTEIAAMLGVSESTVKKGRARLRRRLALPEKESLETFIQTF